MHSRPLHEQRQELHTRALKAQQMLTRWPCFAAPPNRLPIASPSCEKACWMLCCQSGGNGRSRASATPAQGCSQGGRQVAAAEVGWQGCSGRHAGADGDGGARGPCCAAQQWAAEKRGSGGGGSSASRDCLLPPDPASSCRSASAACCRPSSAAWSFCSWTPGCSCSV